MGEIPFSVISILAALIGIALALLSWSKRFREREHAMVHLTEQFSTVAREILDDPLMPEAQNFDDEGRIFFRVSFVLSHRGRMANSRLDAPTRCRRSFGATS